MHGMRKPEIWFYNFVACFLPCSTNATKPKLHFDTITRFCLKRPTKINMAPQEQAPHLCSDPGYYSTAWGQSPVSGTERHCVEYHDLGGLKICSMLMATMALLHGVLAAQMQQMECPGELITVSDMAEIAPIQSAANLVVLEIKKPRTIAQPVRGGWHL
ncbi:hypothetical protein BJX68DRAFT_163176 [Aspergillus pseudodeflectus]|uniref:Uncharacterized protein n=1 Tax=Aspergillus pseudodeflectus TaxID=176178 RepID=A0ABR4L432_9EURO